MSTSLWKKLPTYWPTPETLVWVRRIYGLEPFKATLHVATWEFELETGQLVPWYILDAWRPL
jgi:hypothetical protein